MLKVHKYILIFISGILWSGVGVFLILLAIGWFSVLATNEIILSVIIGVLLGCAIAYFGFSGLANKNIYRINKYQERVNIWAFQKWTSYLIIVFMMSLGIFMRHSGLIPKFILSPMYIGIGLALFLAGLNYYKFLIKHRK